MSLQQGARPTRSSTRQATLFTIKRGVKRDRETEATGRVQSGHDDTGDSKRVRPGDGKDDGGERAGITTDVSELVPVRNEAFLSAFRVQGMQDVYYQPHWVSHSQAYEWQRELDALVEWYRPTLRVYGKEIRQSRSIAAFSTTAGTTLKYSGHQVEMHHPFPALLERIAGRLATSDCLGKDVKFNHCMLNRYEDGTVYIGKHSDNLENQVIVTVSLGAERSWVMEEKVPRASAVKGKRFKWTLHNGSLVVMQGDAQKRYTHEIPKEPKISQPRISITFRQLLEKAPGR